VSIDTIELWHKRARPNPTERDFNVQLGCHLEEVAEMLNELVGEDFKASDALAAAYDAVSILATALKQGEFSVWVPDMYRKDFLDSLADQIVTATGVGHCAGMQTAHAVRRVDQSNWTKYVDGQPVFDANGKIAKPDSYQPPNLEGLY
jgi:ABC-type branched-subunit amino acid transport system substrate-binding protein